MADVENPSRGDLPRRKKGSPVGWFPRGRTESYLERKIRLLQESQGMKGSLDETLGASSRHLSRIEREKRSAVAAAQDATETRKSALVEASWCRILKAARIPYISAALELQKAEKKAADAFNKAAALGVVLRTNSPNTGREAAMQEHANPVTPSSSKFKVTASLDTAFEVDEEVAAALKSALEQIESTSKEPAAGSVETAAEVPFSNDGSNSNSTTTSSSLTDLMLHRVRSLEPEQRAALASIVATRGLNALLKEESFEQELNAKSGEAGLGDVLVKHVSRLEAEKAAAAAAKADEPNQQQVEKPREPLLEMSNDAELQPVKKKLSKLEMEKQAFAGGRPDSSSSHRRKLREQETANMWGGLDLGGSLKRHVSKLEADQAAWRRAAEDAKNKAC